MNKRKLIDEANRQLTGNEEPYQGYGLHRMLFHPELGANIWFKRNYNDDCKPLTTYHIKVSGHHSTIEKRLKNFLGEVTILNLNEKMEEAKKFLDEIGSEYACPVCHAGFSSSVAHVASHAIKATSQDFEFSTSWKTPNGASGINYWKFDNYVSEEMKSFVVGAVADYRAEHIDSPANGDTTIVSQLFGRA